MRQLLAATVLIVVCVHVASSASTGEHDIHKIYPHDRFFKALTPVGKHWILNLALRHEAQRVIRIGPIAPMPIDQPFALSANGSKPIDDIALIPEELLDIMLNGEVTLKFQKDFIHWLRQKYGIEDHEFAQFSSVFQLICHNGQCWDLGDIGDECCPF